MKHIFTYILAAVLLLCGCNKNAGNTYVYLSSAGGDFINNEAELILSLTNRLDYPVNVSLALRSGNIPADHISFQKVVTIPAGEDAVAVSVQINNAEQLDAGLYEATFTISASSGAGLDTRKNSTTLHLKVDEKPINNS